MKKILVIAGVLAGLILTTAVVLPFVVDVDRYRPQLVKAVNDKIQGNLELGKLSLSLWGQIRVQIEGVTLSDSRGRKILSVSDGYFHLPFSSIFSGEPVLTLRLKKPAVSIVKDATGKLNVMTLMKSEAAPAGQAPAPSLSGAPQGGAPTQPSSTVALPSLVTKARLGIEFDDATLTYRDEVSHLDTRIDRLHLAARDLSITRPMSLEANADLDTTVGKEISVKGPLHVEGQASVRLATKDGVGSIEEASAHLTGDFSKLDIQLPGTFEKKAGVTAQLEAGFKMTPADLRLEKCEFRFLNAVLTLSGDVKNLSAGPIAALSLKSNSIELAPWAKLVPSLKEYELGGSASFDGQVNGPVEKLGYRGTLAVNALTARSPMLKTQPKIDGKIQIVTDRVESMVFTMKAPGNDLKIQGQVNSFTQPSIQLAVSSSGMDLDQLLVLPEKKPAAATAPADSKPGAKTAAGGKAAPAADMDALLDPLRQNPMAAKMSVSLAADLKKVKIYGMEMTDLATRAGFKNLVASIDSYSMKLWGGSISAKGASELAPKQPTYRFETQVQGLDLKQAVESQVALFKNTVVGKADFQMSGSGVSFNPEIAKARLSAKGKMKVANAAFASLDVGKMVTDGIAKTISSVSDKIPGMKGKSFPAPPSIQSKYSEITSDFTIEQGQFKAPNFATKAEQGKGFDLKGNTEVGLIDLALKADWELIDTFNLTKAKDYSVTLPPAGTQVQNILVEPGHPFRLPVSAGCTVMAPCVSYTKAPEFLIKVATSNITRAAGGQAKAELQKKATQQLQNAVKNPKVQDAIQGLGKKLFGR